MEQSNLQQLSIASSGTAWGKHTVGVPLCYRAVPGSAVWRAEESPGADTPMPFDVTATIGAMQCNALQCHCHIGRCSAVIGSDAGCTAAGGVAAGRRPSAGTGADGCQHG